MAVRNIVKEGEDVLRKVSRPVTSFSDKTWTLLNDMAETMYQADGVGLAAPQVGVLRRIVVIDVGEGLIELINPVVVLRRGVHKQYHYAPDFCPSSLRWRWRKRDGQISWKIFFRHLFKFEVRLNSAGKMGNEVEISAP